MSNEKQTAVDWLIKKISEKHILFHEYWEKEIEQAKALEKQQIVDAFDNGLTIKMDGEQYYAQTYNQ